MRKIFIAILLFTSSVAFAQDSLKTFNDQRNHVTGTGMEVLGLWSVINIGAGAVGWTSSAGTPKYFYQMNVIWNVVNFGTAITGFTNVQRNKNKKLTAAESLAEQKRLEKIFLINGGLDLVYIGTGTFLKLRGDNRNDAELKGYGASIIMQGAFLLLFDGVMYHAERSNGSKLRNFLEKNPVTFDGKRIGMVINL